MSTALTSPHIQSVDRALPVVEHFATWQGEGTHTGARAYFIRLAGCDVGCHWCDTKYSWSIDEHPYVSIDALVQSAANSEPECVVISGGEPLMHDLSALSAALAGYHRHLETAGVHPLSGTWEWVCLSPKKWRLPDRSCYEAANALKIIVYNQHDLIFAKEAATQVSPQCCLLLQPEWSKEQDMLPHILDFAAQHPSWRLSLQLHKYLNVR